MARVALQEYCDQARELIDGQQYGEAIAICRHILKRYPRHVRTYQILGEACLENGELTEAIDIFKRLLANADPENLTAYAGLGVIYQEQGQLAEAIWYMERAFELAPNNEETRNTLRLLYLQRDGAEPDRIRHTKAALARLYARGGQYRQAIEEFRRLLEAEEHRGRMDLKVSLAETLWRDSRREQAAELTREILQAAPDCLKAILLLGKITIEKGRHEEGNAILDQTRGLDPENRVAQALFGEASPLPPEVVLIPRMEPEAEAAAVEVAPPAEEIAPEAEIAAPETAEAAAEPPAMAEEAEAVEPAPVEIVPPTEEIALEAEIAAPETAEAAAELPAMAEEAEAAPPDETAVEAVEPAAAEVVPPAAETALEAEIVEPETMEAPAEPPAMAEEAEVIPAETPAEAVEPALAEMEEETAPAPVAEETAQEGMAPTAGLPVLAAVAETALVSVPEPAEAKPEEPAAAVPPAEVAAEAEEAAPKERRSKPTVPEETVLEAAVGAAAGPLSDIERYRLLVEQKPKDDKLRLTLARAFRDGSQMKLALEQYAVLVRARQKLLPEIIADVEGIVASRPDNLEAHELLADLYGKNGQLQKALERYHWVLERMREGAGN